MKRKMIAPTDVPPSVAIADKKDITNINAMKLVTTGNTGELIPSPPSALGMPIQEEPRGTGVSGMRSAYRCTMNRKDGRTSQRLAEP